MTLSLGPYQPDSFTALKPPRVANQVGTALAAPAARWYRVAGKGARVPTILIVEDEPEITALLRSYLERDGHHVLTAADGEAAVREVEAALLGDLTVDFRGQEARRQEEPCRLTHTEWRVLEVLASHPGQVFTRLQLIDQIYGYAFEGFERTVDAHIKNLRQKIELNPREPRYVLTVYGAGYKFAANG